MKTRYTVLIICIAVFVVSSIMITAYAYPELFGLTRPYSKIGEYDGTVSEIALMINEQCSNKNQFGDYPFVKTSNGYYYIDNVICERINVQQGGCLEPFSIGYPDETCKNRVTFDYPYGETGPYFSKEFCSKIKSWGHAATDTVENKRMISEWLHICTIRGLADDKSEPEITTSYDKNEQKVDWSEITLMKPNSARHFYYPNPEQTENRDVFQMFSLIRLPEHLGGDADDISAFRAYSGVTLTTDHCVVKYWPDPGRHRMEDPCWGSMYRVIDGLMITNPDLIMNTSPVALPYLELSMDECGSLFVEPPTFTREANGAIGTGRFISSQEIDHGSQIMIDGYEKSHPNHPKVPLRFAGNYLTELHAYGNDVNVRYADLKSLSSPYIDLWIDNVSSADQQYFMNFKSPNSEFWQLGDVVFKISGHALDPNNAQSKYPQEYRIEFILDGFMFLIVGTDDKLLKKAIILNYFPEHSYDDMFLISTTVGK
ncbi:hypothetical protein [Nitrosopumilus sp.]|uniref:hypothetical protein n=1 Tax=Nitrosopumilus sp. TaxID=2024843 RepID=UPI003B59F1B2